MTKSASNTVGVCHGEQHEHRSSDCQFGCKVFRCDGCGWEYIQHMKVYGCATDRREGVYGDG